MMAFTQNEKIFQPGFEKDNTSINGCVGFYGAYDIHSAFKKKTFHKPRAKLLKLVFGGTPDKLTNLYENLSPFHWSARNLPPCMLIQGESDSFISLNETKEMHKKIFAESNVDQVFLKVPLVEHAFDILGV